MPTWDVRYDDAKDNALKQIRDDKTIPANVRDFLDAVVSAFPAGKNVRVIAYGRIDNDLGDCSIVVKTY